MKHVRKNGLALKLFSAEPCRFNDVLAGGLNSLGVDFAARQAPRKPDLAFPCMRIEKFFNLSELKNLHMEPAFFKDFALGCTEQIFRFFRATSGSNPKIVCAWLLVADKQDFVVVFDDDAGGDSMFHALYS